MSDWIPHLFATWFLLSALSQLPYAMRRRNKWRALGLFPTWYFFNNPLAAKEIYLAYRRVLGGDYLPWQEVPLSGSRRWLHAFWHPERRPGKMLLDIAAQILTMRVRLHLELEIIQNSLPYKTALELVRSRAGLSPGDVIQFSLQIGESAPDAAPPRIAFLSGVHRL